MTDHTNTKLAERLTRYGETLDAARSHVTPLRESPDCRPRTSRALAIVAGVSVIAVLVAGVGLLAGHRGPVGSPRVGASSTPRPGPSRKAVVSAFRSAVRCVVESGAVVDGANTHLDLYEYDAEVAIALRLTTSAIATARSELADGSGRTPVTTGDPNDVLRRCKAPFDAVAARWSHALGEPPNARLLELLNRCLEGHGLPPQTSLLSLPLAPMGVRCYDESKRAAFGFIGRFAADVVPTHQPSPPGES